MSQAHIAVEVDLEAQPVVVAMPAYFGYSLKASGLSGDHNLTLPVLISLLVCLIPTTIGGLLSAIGISGMDRLLRKNVIATSGRAIEAAGDTDVLLLDKTGTITLTAMGKGLQEDVLKINVE